MTDKVIVLFQAAKNQSTGARLFTAEVNQLLLLYVCWCFYFVIVYGAVHCM